MRTGVNIFAVVCVYECTVADDRKSANANVSLPLSLAAVLGVVPPHGRLKTFKFSQSLKSLALFTQYIYHALVTCLTSGQRRYKQTVK